MRVFEGFGGVWGGVRLVDRIDWAIGHVKLERTLLIKLNRLTTPPAPTNPRSRRGRVRAARGPRRRLCAPVPPHRARVFPRPLRHRARPLGLVRRPRAPLAPRPGRDGARGAARRRARPRRRRAADRDGLVRGRRAAPRRRERRHDVHRVGRGARDRRGAADRCAWVGWAVGGSGRCGRLWFGSVLNAPSYSRSNLAFSKPETRNKRPETRVLSPNTSAYTRPF